MFNGSISDGTLAAASHAPVSYDGSWRRVWLQLRRSGPGSFLLALDFFVRVGDACLLASVFPQRLAGWDDYLLLNPVGRRAVLMGYFVVDRLI